MLGGTRRGTLTSVDQATTSRAGYSCPLGRSTQMNRRGGGQTKEKWSRTPKIDKGRLTKMKRLNAVNHFRCMSDIVADCVDRPLGPLI